LCQEKDCKNGKIHKKTRLHPVDLDLWGRTILRGLATRQMHLSIIRKNRKKAKRAISAKTGGKGQTEPAEYVGYLLALHKLQRTLILCGTWGVTVHGANVPFYVIAGPFSKAVAISIAAFWIASS